MVLREILNWANRLVPSESGSILLDDPALKMRSGKRGRLCFAACFGRGAASLVGTSIADYLGIAGTSYKSSTPHISKDVLQDRRFYPKIDEAIGFRTKSIICSPIDIDGAVIGVIELVNKKSGLRYDREDLELLRIFAGYTATLIKNVLIGRDVEEEARRDNLTGLYNERFFFRSLEVEIGRVIREGGDVSLIFFDLDHFKEVNDRYGHLAGSAVLREVGDLLRKIFRGADAVMARYGGDEYVVALRGKGLEDSMPYAEGVREAVASRTFLRKAVSGDSLPLNIRGVVTCSVGVASLNRNGAKGCSVRLNAERLIKAADNAMYSAKESGKNGVCASPDPRSAQRRAGRRRKRGPDASPG